MIVGFDFTSEPTPNALSGVLEDKLAYCVFRNAVSAKVCATLTERFSKVVTASRRDDEVPGDLIGTFHFLKDPAAYLTSVPAANKQLGVFFEDLGNPLEQTVKKIAAYYADKGFDLSVAEGPTGQECGAYIARRWLGKGKFSLSPHDDFAQLTFPPQSELTFFAPQPTVCNLNLCIKNDGVDSGGGKLVIWDWRPDTDDRHRYGVQFSGFPYPEEALAGVEKVEIDINPGDLYAINGRFVHAVTDSPPHKQRVTIATMLAFSSKRKNCIEQWV